MSTPTMTPADQTWKPGEAAAAVQSGVCRASYAAACERPYVKKRGRARRDVALDVWLAAAQSWDRAVAEARESASEAGLCDTDLILRLGYDGALVCDGCGAREDMEGYAAPTPGGVADLLLRAGWRANETDCHCPGCVKGAGLS